jgi:hypothetical protein
MMCTMEATTNKSTVGENQPGTQARNCENLEVQSLYSSGIRRTRSALHSEVSHRADHSIALLSQDVHLA